MGFELLHEVVGEQDAVAGGDVLADVLFTAHAGDDGGDGFVGENPAERHFGHGHVLRDEGLESIGMFDAGFEILGDKVTVAPVALCPFGVEGEGSGEGTFVEGDAGDDADVVFVADGK